MKCEKTMKGIILFESVFSPSPQHPCLLPESIFLFTMDDSFTLTVRDSNFLHYTHQVDITHMWDRTQLSRSWTKACSLGSHNMYYYCIIEPKAQLRVLLRGRLGPQGLSTCRGMLGQETKPQTLLMAVPTVCQCLFLLMSRWHLVSQTLPSVYELCVWMLTT